MDVNQFITEYNLAARVEAGLGSAGYDSSLLKAVGSLPVRKSHAVRRLGAYVTRGADPSEIRLQFALPEQELVDTFLHELAHCLDHRTNQKGKPYRRAHGSGWQRWAEALGVAPQRSCESAALRRIHEQRLKVVAVCRRCGFELLRVRRLPRNRKYLHTECGGKFRVVT